MVQLLSADMKEFSDGEMTVALASVTTDKEVKHAALLISTNTGKRFKINTNKTKAFLTMINHL